MAFVVRASLGNGNSNRSGGSRGRSGSSSAPSSNNWSGNVADEATVDAYAMRVLEEANPSEVSVDADYLGPYITGVLRAEQADNGDALEDLPDYDNVIELLQEHCSMARDDAKNALEKIARAVRTGVVPLEYTATAPISSPPLGPFGSPPSLSSSRGLDALQLLGNVNVAAAAAAQQNPSNGTSSSSEFTSHLADSSNSTQARSSFGAAAPNASVISPVQPDNLIPVDLLGAIDDDLEENDVTPFFGQLNLSSSAVGAPAEEEFPSLEVAAASKMTRKASRSTRSRQESIDESLQSEHSSKKVSPHLQPTAASAGVPYYNSLDNNSSSNNMDPATLLQMTCDMLAGMNPDLGQDAIFQAATMAQSNVGVAQYLMDCAMTAPPVCRHLLNAGCYRSDCQFSHDLEGHTCVFWLRGRCGKGSACPFLHGYNGKWLEQLEQQQQQLAEEEMSYATSQQEQYFSPQQWEQQQHVSATTTNTSSFANIAQQGYNGQTCFQYSKSRSSSLGSLPSSIGEYDDSAVSASTVPSMRIPQDVWNPHERRDASAFHIVDPMERYREVSRAHNSQIVSGRNQTARGDVIDLHFQSTKTYAVVLANVLPEKLSMEPNGVWIVTGTGHHVGSKTHQKGGGVLESAVITWLLDHGYEFLKGRDRNGHGGALFVKNTSSNDIGQ